MALHFLPSKENDALGGLERAATIAFSSRNDSLICAMPTLQCSFGILHITPLRKKMADFLYTTLQLLPKIILRIIRPKIKEKKLEFTILGRGIIYETLPQLEISMKDRHGNIVDSNIYAIIIRVWNRGLLPILAGDILETSPITLKLDNKAYILGVDYKTTTDGLVMSLLEIENNKVELRANGFNPGDDALIYIYHSGEKANPILDITGRIMGQTAPFYSANKENLASPIERISYALLFTFIILSFPALILSVSYIIYNFGFEYLTKLDSIPKWVIISMSPGIFIMTISALNAALNYIARKRSPKGFPIYADLYPTFYKNIKNIFISIVTGRRYRISSSLLNYGEPVLLKKTQEKSKKPSDWL